MTEQQTNSGNILESQLLDPRNKRILNFDSFQDKKKFCFDLFNKWIHIDIWNQSVSKGKYITIFSFTEWIVYFGGLVYWGVKITYFLCNSFDAVEGECDEEDDEYCQPIVNKNNIERPFQIGDLK